MLRFEVNSPKHLIELDDGTKVPNQTTMRLPKGGKTSKYGRLFTALNYNGKFRHFAQMVGKGSWLAEITHNVVNEGKDNEKTYANLDKNKAWTFTAPVFENPATGEVSTVPVPELDGEPQVFMFENAGIGDADYKALWDSLYIEGEHESGDKKGQSKNWIQELIQDSLTYDTSRLKQIVEGNSAAELEDLPIDSDGEEEPEQEEEEPVKEEKPKPKTKTKAKKDPEPEPEPEEEPEAEEEESDDDEDPLVAAGLA
jgi:cell division septation protein DedD